MILGLLRVLAESDKLEPLLEEAKRAQAEKLEARAKKQKKEDD